MDDDGDPASHAPAIQPCATQSSEDRDDTTSEPTSPTSVPSLSRRNTMTTDGGTSSKAAETCRICRSEGTPTEPLFYPCKCSGSIKHVHQECLMEWLSHSHKKHCELCKTPFRFTKLYDAQMPQVLPWGVFLGQAAKHVWWAVVKWVRATLVALVWLGVLPWFVRWAWRYMFYFADAGFARDAFLRRIRDGMGSVTGQDFEKNGAYVDIIKQMLATPYATSPAAAHGNNSWIGSLERSTEWAKALGLDLLTHLNFTTTSPSMASGLDWLTHLGSATTTSIASSNHSWLNSSQADLSILSSYSWAADLTPSAQANKILLDVFEGQLITATVIIGFILVFLIREWVVQQQPLVNLENAHMELREAADRLQDIHDRDLRNEILAQARQQLEQARGDTSEGSGNLSAVAENVIRLRFDGWDTLEATIDHATEHRRRGGVADENLFIKGAVDAIKQVIGAKILGVSSDEISQRITTKLSTLSDTERRTWRTMLLTVLELTELPTEHQGPSVDNGEAVLVESVHLEAENNTQNVEDGASSRRPPLERDFSSRMTHVSRFLHEAGAEDDTAHEPDNNSSENPATQPRRANLDEPISLMSSESAPGNVLIQPTPPSPRESQALAQHKDEELALDSTLDTLPLPITNAGPDARITITRAASARGKRIVLQPPADDAISSVDEELKRAIENVDLQRWVPRSTAMAGSGEQNLAAVQHVDAAMQQDHPGAVIPPGVEDSFTRRMASAFKEEFGLDEAEELENLRRLDIAQNGGNPPEANGSREASPERHDDAAKPHGPIGKLLHWFWGDLQPAAVIEVIPLINEERVAADGRNEAALRHGENNQLPDDHAVQEALAQAAQEIPPEHDDPEALAAAQQAGLDAEAIEDAEDLEGIFELIGMQGPIIGLFQTATFCTVLVTTTVFGAVGLPYVWGKLVLSFIGAPMHFLVKTPLQVAGFVTDFIIDITLLLGGWLVVLGAMALNAVAAGVGSAFPKLIDPKTLQLFMNAAVSTSHASGNRLQNMFVRVDEGNSMGWYWAFLSGSCHAHQSLKDIEMEVNVVLDYIRSSFQVMICALGDESPEMLKSLLSSVTTGIPRIPTLLHSSGAAIHAYMQPYVNAVASLKGSGLTLTISSSDRPFNPTLIYWNPTDRSLTILVGYISLAVVAAIYVAADTPITMSEAGRKTEKLVRDTLRQAGGVLKVIVIINIEMLIFPFYCGLLLDFAFLPLFEGASIASRLAFAARAPTIFCFVHWISGTAYMFHFALFVGMCRKILRKGVLWFIRDPDDPTFHPVRDVLERNVLTQLRKIAFSALVYGALVILGLGGVVWTIGKVFNGIFPLKWVSTEPVLEFPLDLLLYNFVTPLLLRMIRPSDGVQVACGWWLKKCARVLRLSHFLFDTRQADEEIAEESNADGIDAGTEAAGSSGSTTTNASHRGGFCLTPNNDQYRPPKSGEAYLHVHDTDVFIANGNGKRNEHFNVVYVPPRFKLRIAAFMGCLWAFTAFTGLIATLVPLAFGRAVLGALVKKEAINDIYAYTLGAYTLGSIVTLSLNWKALHRVTTKLTPGVNMKAAVDRIQSIGGRVAKCLYVYGFLGVVLPSLFALLLHFYFILPLHTYAASMAAQYASSNNTSVGISAVKDVTESAIVFLNTTTTDNLNKPRLTSAGVAEHSFHVLQNYALGLLYIRIASRFIMTTPTSRAAEAFRRITEAGYLNPNARLATRFVILPSILLASLALVLPLGIAQLAIFTTNHGLNVTLTALERTKLYRYAYPMAAGWVVAALGTIEVGKATGRWRARIRDEVYLVGERLHNFGEKKPPEGSKSVVRRER